MGEDGVPTGPSWGRKGATAGTGLPGCSPCGSTGSRKPPSPARTAGPMRMSDLAIPTDAVIAGVRKRSFDALPSRFRRQELAALRLRILPHLPHRHRPPSGGRGCGRWRRSSIRVWSRPIVVGGDDLTRDLNVVDAASLSSAIPGVLHHETSDLTMIPILDAMLHSNDCGAFIDGGTASNVPVELAWKRVRDGRLGTRNACYLAFDCFHPQWDARQLWMVPIAQAIRLQTLRNVPYADHLVRFAPTLSPMNLAPSAAAIERACGWGGKSVDRAIPVVTALLEPIWWDGHGPPTARAREVAPAKSVAWPMSAVLSAMQLPHNRFQRWRDRHLT